MRGSNVIGVRGSGVIGVNDSPCMLLLVTGSYIGVNDSWPLALRHERLPEHSCLGMNDSPWTQMTPLGN